MKQRFLLLGKLSLAVLVTGIIFLPGVRAQTDQDTTTFGVTIAPVIDEFTSESGTTTERSIKITNPVQEVVTLYPQALNIYSDNDKGQPKFYSLNERNSKYAVSDWITFSKPLIRIAPGEVEEFVYKLTVPKDSEPGGHYGAVLFSTKPPVVATADPKVSQVSVVGLVGTLVLHTTPGKVIQEATLTDYTAPTVLIRPPANFSLTFQNTGNVHVKPTGEIKIRNMFGAVITSLKVNDGGGNVLPDSTRKFEASWGFNWKQIGKYTATAIATFGSPEQQVTSVRIFYVIPIWLLTALGLVILLIIWRVIRKKIKPKLPPPPPAGGPPTPPSPKPEPPKFVMR